MIRSGDMKNPHFMVVKINNQTYVIDYDVGFISTFFLLILKDKRFSVEALDYVGRRKKRLTFTFHIGSRYTRNGILPLNEDNIAKPDKLFNADSSYYLISI